MCLLAERLVKQTTEFMKKTFRETTTTKTKAQRCPIVTVRSDVRPVLHLEEETAR